jgi:hypothetical protein
MGPTEKLARYYAACYVEIPWHESQRAPEMPMGWFGERTMEWVTDECARAGVTTKASEVEMSGPSAPGAATHRRKHGPREQESPLAPQTSPPTMDIYHECATEGCTALACSGGDRQHVQSPYCSDACWREHAKGGRAHGSADTKAWADDTTKNAIWGRGRLNEVNATPRSIGALQVNTKTGGGLPLVEYLLPAAARAGGAVPSPTYSRVPASSSVDDVVGSVPWTLLTSSKSDFGEGCESND